MIHTKKVVKIILFVVLPIIILLGIVSMLLVLHNTNALVQQRVVSMLEKQFPDADIQYESIEFIPYQGIYIRGLQVQIPEKVFSENPKFPVDKKDLVIPKNGNEIHKFLSIEEIFVEAPFSRIGLIVRGVANPNVQIQNTDVYLYPISSNRWNFQYLSFGQEDLEQLQNPFGQITLKNAHLHIQDYRKKNNCDCYTLQDIEAQITLTSNKEYAITGKIKDSLSKTIEINGTYNPEKRQLKITGKVNKYEITEQLLNSLPIECSELTNVQYVKSFSGDFAVECSLTYDSSLPSGKNIKYNINGKLTNGKLICDFPQRSNSGSEKHDIFSDFQIPNELDIIDGAVSISESRLFVRSLVVKMGKNTIDLEYRQDGYYPDANKRLVIRLRDFVLSEEHLALIKQMLAPIKQKSMIAAVPSSFAEGALSKPINTDIIFAFKGDMWEISFSDFPFSLLKCTYKNNILRGTLLGVTGRSQIFKLKLEGPF